MHSPRLLLPFRFERFMLWPDHKLKQTEPCGPLHGGGPEPYGRWKWTFSDGNREPWSGDGGWADRYASCGIHLLKITFMLDSHMTAATHSKSC